MPIETALSCDECWKVRVIKLKIILREKKSQLFKTKNLKVIDQSEYCNSRFKIKSSLLWTKQPWSAREINLLKFRIWTLIYANFWYRFSRRAAFFRLRDRFGWVKLKIPMKIQSTECWARKLGHFIDKRLKIFHKNFDIRWRRSLDESRDGDKTKKLCRWGVSTKTPLWLRISLKLPNKPLWSCHKACQSIIIFHFLLNVSHPIH